MALIFQQTKRHDTPLPILPFLSLSGWTKCCHFRCSCGLQFIYKRATSGASQGKSALNWSEMIFTLLSSSTGSQKCALHQQHQSALPRMLLEMQVLGATKTYWETGWPTACFTKPSQWLQWTLQGENHCANWYFSKDPPFPPLWYPQGTRFCGPPFDLFTRDLPRRELKNKETEMMVSFPSLNGKLQF